MSVYRDRAASNVRWRQDGCQRSRRFANEPEALAFEDGPSGGDRKPRSSIPNVYAEETRAGVGWRCSHRSSSGRAASRRSFTSERSAVHDRERAIARVCRPGRYVRRLAFGKFLPDGLRRRMPYRSAGIRNVYEIHGRKRLLLRFGERWLTSITIFERSDWLPELDESGVWAGNTFKDRFGVLVATLDCAAADRLIPVKRWSRTSLGIGSRPSAS